MTIKGPVNFALWLHRYPPPLPPPNKSLLSCQGRIPFLHLSQFICGCGAGERGERRLGVAESRRVVLLLTFPAPLLRLPTAFLVLPLEAAGSLCELTQLNNSAKPGEFSMEVGKMRQRGLNARACSGSWEQGEGWKETNFFC